MKLIPRVKRARDYYLYDEKGNRYLDLYLDGGRALCGHRPNGLSNVLKNAIARGIYAPYPSVYEDRLFKVLKKGFSDYGNVGIYKSLESFSMAYGKNVVFSDPAIGEERSEAVVWRPFLPSSEGNDLLLVRLPYPGIEAVAILSRKSALPDSDLLSPVTTAGLVRSWFDLQNKLSEADDAIWASLDHTGHWQRRGPYLKPLCTHSEYDTLFRQYLDCGILISPEYDVPSFCAVNFKEGTLKKLFRSLKGDKL